MGRALLKSLALAAAAALAACAPEAPPARAGEAHARLTCATCHSGGSAELGRAAVPRKACTGCHEDGGPADVQLATATFPHRQHGRDAAVRPSCAGCHTHRSGPPTGGARRGEGDGKEPLRASVDACALCHAAKLVSQDPEQCRSCHVTPEHARFTSQGVAVRHATLPWAETGCVRCHYDVAEPPVEVSLTRCSNCHTDLAAVTRAGIGSDLHPSHEGLTCTSCHEAGTHRLVAMSSAVDLVCADCHRTAHGKALPTGERHGTSCDGCHRGIHDAQQRLFLGMLPRGQAVPSHKFLAGLTCRSCHVRPAGGEAPARGTAESCAGCHRAEYRAILPWWLDGVRARGRLADGYVAAAARNLAGVRGDSIRALLDGARTELRLVARAGGQHNLELSDRIFRESVERAGSAYRLAGRTPPEPPALGNRPRAGFCSYCHYSPADRWEFDDMSPDFHEFVLSGAKD